MTSTIKLGRQSHEERPKQLKIFCRFGSCLVCRTSSGVFDALEDFGVNAQLDLSTPILRCCGDAGTDRTSYCRTGDKKKENLDIHSVRAEILGN